MATPTHRAAYKVQKPHRRIPGFAGHVHGDHGENNFGKAFLAAQREGHVEKERELFTAREPQNVIPGYMGHMPGKSENVIGQTYVNQKILQMDGLAGKQQYATYEPSSRLQEPSKELLTGRAGSEIPHYTGFIPGVRPEAHIMGGTRRNINDRAHLARGKETTHRHPHFVPPCAPEDAKRGPHKTPDTVIPGFMGHVHGISEGVVGKVNKEAHREAYMNLGLHHVAGVSEDTGPGATAAFKGPAKSPQVEKIPQGAHRAAISVPGYAGHIPGKKAFNVFGKTHGRANVKSAMEKFLPPDYDGRTASYPNSTTSASTASKIGSKESKGSRSRGTPSASMSGTSPSATMRRSATAPDGGVGDIPSLPSSSGGSLTKSSLRRLEQSGAQTARGPRTPVDDAPRPGSAGERRSRGNRRR